VGEDATDVADATAFCITVASTRNAKTSVLPFAGVVVAVVVATARCTLVATTTELEPN
jgi:hypothetical protein